MSRTLNVLSIALAMSLIATSVEAAHAPFNGPGQTRLRHAAKAAQQATVDQLAQCGGHRHRGGYGPGYSRVYSGYRGGYGVGGYGVGGYAPYYGGYGVSRGYINVARPIGYGYPARSCGYGGYGGGYSGIGLSIGW